MLVLKLAKENTIYLEVKYVKCKDSVAGGSHFP